jgi:hypothetical protein
MRCDHDLLALVNGALEWANGRNCPIWQRHARAGTQPRDLRLQIPAVVVIVGGRCPFRIPVLVSVRW